MRDTQEDIHALLSVIKMQQMTIDACCSLLRRFGGIGSPPPLPDYSQARMEQIIADYS